MTRDGLSMTVNPHLSDQVGAERFQTLCLLTDLQSNVADAWREYVTSGGQLNGLRQPLGDAAKVIMDLLNNINNQESR